MKVNLRGGLCVGWMMVLLVGCSEEDAPTPAQSAAGTKTGGGEKPEPVSPAPDAGGGEEEPDMETPEPEVPKEVGTAVRWTDEAGNFGAFSDNPELVNPDLIAVDATSKGGNFVAVYRFAPGNLEKCQTQMTGDPPTNFGSSVSELYLDLDNDRATGATLGEGENEQGYELKISVMTGFSFVDPASGEANAMFGDVGLPDGLTGVKAEASQTTRVLDSTVEQRGSWGKMSSEARDADGRRLTVLGKDLMAVYVPYEWFGMKPGDVIRVAYTDEKGEDDGISEVKRVKLK